MVTLQGRVQTDLQVIEVRQDLVPQDHLAILGHLVAEVLGLFDLVADLQEVDHRLEDHLQADLPPVGQDEVTKCKAVKTFP